MPSKYNQFKDLHHRNDLLILPNAWDAKSALVFQEQNFTAIGTSSAAVAASLGYADGEAMPFSHYLLIIERIMAGVQVPVTVDLEMGYGKTSEAIAGNMEKLVELGVAGINIEDSEITGSRRSLKDAGQFAQLIEQARNRLLSKNLELFINIRCDTYVLDVAGKHEETARRLKLYEGAGADGIFLPGISDETDIAAAVSNTRLPVNVMAVPGLPGFDTLMKLGVRRVSMGPFLFMKTYQQAAELSRRIVAEKSVSPVL